MKKSRFTEEKILGVLREAEAGAKAPELCRRNGISEATYDNWKARHGGMDVSQLRRLTECRDHRAAIAMSGNSLNTPSTPSRKNCRYSA
jgi:putative transposase